MRQSCTAAFRAPEDDGGAPRDRSHGLGPDYRVPGLPHRAGRGRGLAIHEEPSILRGNQTPLEPGMCFSKEPMVLVPDALGVRLEDHVAMTENGPRWFKQPSAEYQGCSQDGRLRLATPVQAASTQAARLPKWKRRPVSPGP